MKEFIRKLVSEIVTQVSSFGGIVFYSVILATVLFIDITLFLKLFLGLIIGMIFGIGIKHLFFKDRPKREKYSSKLEKIDASSFPSIHAIRIFTLSAILSLYFKNIFLIIIFTFLSLLVCYSRIQLEKHYFKDVFWGAIIGIIIGLTIALVV